MHPATARRSPRRSLLITAVRAAFVHVLPCAAVIRRGRSLAYSVGRRGCALELLGQLASTPCNQAANYSTAALKLSRCSASVAACACCRVAECCRESLDGFFRPSLVFHDVCARFATFRGFRAGRPLGDETLGNGVSSVSARYNSSASSDSFLAGHASSELPTVPAVGLTLD